MSVCSISVCDGKSVARRLCRAHYQQAWKAGSLGTHEKFPTRPRLRDRTVCPPEHKHAANTTCFILHQCRCDPCMDFNAQRERDRKKQIAYGRYDSGLVDVAPVREHVLMLGEYGLGYKRISKLAGFRSSTPVRTILWGRQDPGPRKGEMQKRIKRETAEKVFRIRPALDLLAGGQIIPARGAHRRVQALVARGWSLSKIGHLVGVTPSNFSMTMQTDQVTVATHRAIVEVYDRLWDQEPDRSTPNQEAAYTRSLAHAKRNGWAPPLAWDDIDLDSAPDFGDPADGSLIDEQAVELAVSGLRVKLSPAERRAAVTRLHGQRLGDRAIAERLGIAERTVLRIRGELGLESWTIAEQQAGISEARSGRKAA